MRLVRPLEAQKRKTVGGPKICLVDHGLRASFLSENLPLSRTKLKTAHPDTSSEVGEIVESIVGAWLARVPSSSLAWFPQRDSEPEVDFVLTIGDQRIPIEVKYRRQLRVADSRNLRAFIDKPAHRAPFGIIVTQDEQVVHDDRIVAVPLSSLLLLMP